jgi:putative heme-binding domain-containing protein
MRAALLRLGLMAGLSLILGTGPAGAQTGSAPPPGKRGVAAPPAGTVPQPRRRAEAVPEAPAPGQGQADPFRRDNLVAWCIVPFDDRERTPEERADMLVRLGLKKYAYDYRAQHVPTFDAEMRAIKARGIELTGWWFPAALNDEARLILSVLERNGVRTQLWVTGSGAPATSPEDQRAKVVAEAARIRPIAEAAARIGCTVGLYNHGGWFGEPENQVEIIRELGLKNVGIVYNLHHGHDHLNRFPALLTLMKPHLYCLNLNGMVEQGDRKGLKIMPLGEGDLDAGLLKAIRASGYTGPIGILNHTQANAEHRLLDNLDGLDWLLPQLAGRPAGPRPKLRTWTSTAPAPKNTPLLAGNPAFRDAPVTVQARATLVSKQGYNILVANETKASGGHWEIFTEAGSGLFTAYLPGRQPDHIRSKVDICDGKPHTVGMVLEAKSARLYIDGQVVAEGRAVPTGKAPVDGGLAIGRLVEEAWPLFGRVHWATISRGVVPIPAGDVETPRKDGATLLLWNSDNANAAADLCLPPANGARQAVVEYSPAQVATELAAARATGDAERGLMVFGASTSACLSCHKLGKRGGTIGPDLLDLAKKRTPEQIVESVIWPDRHIEPEYVTHLVETTEGKLVRGYKVREADGKLVLKDPANGTEQEIATADIVERSVAGTLMPLGLTGALDERRRADLFRLLLDLGRDGGIDGAKIDSLFEQWLEHLESPAFFVYEKPPLRPEDWPHASHSVNRDRLYDFYAKEAEHFRARSPVPRLLPEFPGLDGGTLGHWGNQNEAFWKDGRWNNVRFGSMQAGVFHGPKSRITRGVAVRVTGTGEGRDGVSVCFNPDTARYEALWRGGFVNYSEVRHGFIEGMRPSGDSVTLPQEWLDRPAGVSPDAPVMYLGFYRHGEQVLFAYRIGETEYLDTVVVENGQPRRIVAPRAEHPLADRTRGGPAQWPTPLSTAIRQGTTTGPYVVDTIELPVENPWNIPLFCGGHGFSTDGSAYVGTMHGDVWHVSGFARADADETGPPTAKWRRFASGLHHPLGIVVDADGVFVLCRDQITRLHDLDRDGEADFYECFSNAFITSPAGHDYICGLERDAAGCFYTASGNQGLVRISPDGKRAEVLATGFRNPDGLGLHPDGSVTIPCSEGDWTPASMICQVRVASAGSVAAVPPHFGAGGPKDDRAPSLPLAYLPRGLDNSSGGQTYIDSPAMGPLHGQMVHFSFGTGTQFVLLRDRVGEVDQGGVVPLTGEFLSGAHRGRINPVDGFLYVTGMQGWGSYTPADGCFQRVRPSGRVAQLPVAYHVHRNGVLLTFSEPLDRAVASDPRSHFAQAWNYRYSRSYGSPEFSTRHFGRRGHDHFPISAAHVLPDGKRLFLELPDLQPVNQLHLRVRTGAGEPSDLFLTVHALDEPLTTIPDYRPVAKSLQPHPQTVDLKVALSTAVNPWRQSKKSQREIVLRAGGNLTYDTRMIKVRPREAIKLTFENPDVVPHNWALLRPGTLEQVGDLANRLVADPEAAANHYIPDSPAVLVWTDVVYPGDMCRVYFDAPAEPGRYPFLCTFPGHWLVMNGELIVEAGDAK